MVRKREDGFEVEVVVESNRGNGSITWREMIPLSEFADDMTAEQAQEVIMDYINESFRNDVYFDADVIDGEGFRDYFDPISRRERELLEEAENNERDG